MTIRWNRNTFYCVPIAWVLPVMFLLITFLSIFFALWIMQVDQDAIDVAIVFWLSALTQFFIFVFTFATAAWRVSVQEYSIVCKGWLPHHKFVLEYEKCTVGMDWHEQNGNKIWWIYLTYGYKPSYQSKNPAKRINSQKCRPGFIRIMYSDEVYQSLISVLPKNQNRALEAARKFAGFNQQGTII